MMMMNALERSLGRERRSDGRLFQTEGSTTEKALCCITAVRACGTIKSPLEADRKELRPRQEEVKVRSTCRYDGTLPNTQCQTREEILKKIRCCGGSQ